MIIGKIKVSGTTATVDWSTEIPKGLVGGKVQIEYTDDIWSGLNKTVVFRSSITRDVLENGSEVIIPADVLERSGVKLYVGVYGTDAENNLICISLMMSTQTPVSRLASSILQFYILISAHWFLPDQLTVVLHIP